MILKLNDIWWFIALVATNLGYFFGILHIYQMIFLFNFLALATLFGLLVYRMRLSQLKSKAPK